MSKKDDPRSWRFRRRGKGRTGNIRMPGQTPVEGSDEWVTHTQRVLARGGLMPFDGALPQEALKAWMEKTGDSFTFQMGRTPANEEQMGQTFSMKSIIETGRLIMAFILSRVMATWEKADYHPDAAPHVCIVKVDISWSEIDDA